MLDFDKFAATPLVQSPFEYLIVPGFVHSAAAAEASASFPAPDVPGVLPAPPQCLRDGFGRLLAALRSLRTTEVFAEKFGLALSVDTLMVTLRSRCRLRDGAIHTDTALKQVTALIYLNDGWLDEGGRLRLLNGPDDIDDMIAEIPPLAGTLLAFRRSDNSWHGHKPFAGVRRAIMLNWMTNASAARRESARRPIAGLRRSIVVNYVTPDWRSRHELAFPAAPIRDV
jgi:hypothetical protein